MMAYIVTKLITEEDKAQVYLIGSFTDMKQAAAAATEEYKVYNKNASFINLEMVNEWLSTRGEYSFRQDRQHRIQLDISRLEDNQVVPEQQQVIFTVDGQGDKAVELSSHLVPDGVQKAEL